VLNIVISVLSKTLAGICNRVVACGWKAASVSPLTDARRLRYSIAECDFMQQSIKDKRFAVCCRVLDVRKSTELSSTIPGGRFHANRDQVS